jgi:hypothetical protein
MSQSKRGKMKREIDRRRFFRRCAAGAALAALPASALAETACAAESHPAAVQGASYPAGPVIVARSDRLKTTSDSPSSGEVRRLLDQALLALTRAQSASEAWRRLFKPEDIVALKLNCISRGISSRPEVVAAIIAGLASAGIPPRNVLIWERTSAELERAGYRIATSRDGGSIGGARCFGTDALSGGGYEGEPEIIGEVGSCFSTVLTRYTTAVINVPVFKDHDLAGVSIALKNNFGVIHNPNRYHSNNCDPFVAHLNSVGHLLKKQRLVVCDALTAQCHAGPSYKAAYAWPFGGLLVAADPVALDAVGADIIEKRRRETGLPSLAEAGRPPRWLDTAHGLGLGVGRLDKITVKEIG